MREAPKGRKTRVPQSYSKLYSHLVFSTKGREPTITSQFQDRLYDYISGILRNKGCLLIKAGGTADHIHLLMLVARETSTSDIVRDIKTNSSKWIHETLPGTKGFAWQRGFGAFSVGHSQKDDIVRYIENQEEHHRTKTFKEEFVGFLETYEIEYDSNYLWEY